MELCLLVIKQVCPLNKVMVYQIPPRQTARGHLASTWDVEKYIWSGKLKVMSSGCILLEDDQGLFAKAIITDSFLEPVMDSSRYFVLKITETDKHAFIGIGFPDRQSAFDLNVAVQDYHKCVF
jgi:hypothetical protein